MKLSKGPSETPSGTRGKLSSILKGRNQHQNNLESPEKASQSVIRSFLRGFGTIIGPLPQADDIPYNEVKNEAEPYISIVDRKLTENPAAARLLHKLMSPDLSREDYFVTQDRLEEIFGHRSESQRRHTMVYSFQLPCGAHMEMELWYEDPDNIEGTSSVIFSGGFY